MKGMMNAMPLFIIPFFLSFSLENLMIKPTKIREAHEMPIEDLISNAAVVMRVASAMCFGFPCSTKNKMDIKQAPINMASKYSKRDKMKKSIAENRTDLCSNLP